MKAEKKPSYPTFAFRLTAEDKAWLERELEHLKDLVNDKTRKDLKVINKNDILIEGLKRGLASIRAKYKKR